MILRVSIVQLRGKCLVVSQLCKAKQQYMIGKQFDVLTEHAPNQYIPSQQKLSGRKVCWVEVLAEHAANIIYKPDHVHSALDALSWITILNLVGKHKPLPEAVRQAQSIKIDKELLHFKELVSNLTSDFSLDQVSLV